MTKALPGGATVDWEALSTPALVTGDVIADRYEIVSVLGEGGMGTVYKAMDRELNRVIALKVIRPELAGQPGALERFKRELVLTQQVTHKNVVRVFDLGASENLKFITMEFVEGRDLSTALAERQFTEAESIRIIRQACAALAAAHAESVIHRDLKPPNIMIGHGGKVLVLDFGLARSVETSKLTQTGAIMGTPAYMSPEQAKGISADKRSDIFSLGIIFYEMVTGTVPFQGDSSVQMLLKRTQEPSRPPKALNPKISEEVNGVIQKCIELDPANRYQSASELLQDLEILAGNTDESETGAGLPASRAVRSRPPARLSTAPSAPRTAAPPAAARRLSRWAVAGTGALVVMILAAGWAVRGKFGTTAVGSPKAVTMILADFRNDTGDPLFDGRVEPMLRMALEGAPFVDVISRDRAMAISGGIRPNTATLTDDVARRIAVQEGIGVVVSGSIRRRGGYRISVRAVDAATGRTIVSSEADSTARERVPVGKLAAAIRAALGDRTPEAAQLAGRDKFRTRGGYYMATMEPQRAIQEFSALVQQFPGDSAGHASLASAYYLHREMSKALEEARRAVEIYPRNATYRDQMALYALNAGDAETAARESAAVLGQAPSNWKAYRVLALAQLMQGQPAKAEDTYRRMQAVNNVGGSLAAAGLADLALYQSRAADAVVVLEKGVAEDLNGARPEAAAKKLVTIAHARLMLRQKTEAAAALDRAIDVAKDSVLYSSALAYMEVGREDKAARLARDLAKWPEAPQRASVKIVEGEVELKRGNVQSAVRLFQESQKLSDTWLSHFDLGRAYLAARAYAQADSEFDTCLLRRGEATDAFLNEEPAYHLFPSVYYYLGLVREGLKSGGSAELFRTFIGIKVPGAMDAMVDDARRRVGTP